MIVLFESWCTVLVELLLQAASDFTLLEVELKQHFRQEIYSVA